MDGARRLPLDRGLGGSGGRAPSPAHVPRERPRARQGGRRVGLGLRLVRPGGDGADRAVGPPRRQGRRRHGRRRTRPATAPPLRPGDRRRRRDGGPHPRTRRDPRAAHPVAPTGGLTAVDARHHRGVRGDVDACCFSRPSTSSTSDAGSRTRTRRDAAERKGFSSSSARRADAGVRPARRSAGRRATTRRSGSRRTGGSARRGATTAANESPQG